MERWAFSCWCAENYIMSEYFDMISFGWTRDFVYYYFHLKAVIRVLDIYKTLLKNYLFCFFENDNGDKIGNKYEVSVFRRSNRTKHCEIPTVKTAWERNETTFKYRWINAISVEKRFKKVIEFSECEFEYVDGDSALLFKSSTNAATKNGAFERKLVYNLRRSGMY